MIEAFEFLGKYIDYWFLFIVLAAGRAFTRDEVIDGLPFKIKAILLRVNTAWRVFVVSTVVGVLIYFVRKTAGYKIEAESFILTYLIANGLYSLFAKAFINYIEKKLTGSVSSTKP